MTTIETLRKRADALGPPGPGAPILDWMSDEELEQRVKTILADHPDDLDPDLVRQCRHISDRRAQRT